MIGQSVRYSCCRHKTGRGGGRLWSEKANAGRWPGQPLHLSEILWLAGKTKLQYIIFSDYSHNTGCMTREVLWTIQGQLSSISCGRLGYMFLNLALLFEIFAIFKETSDPVSTHHITQILQNSCSCQSESNPPLSLTNLNMCLTIQFIFVQWIQFKVFVQQFPTFSFMFS